MSVSYFNSISVSGSGSDVAAFVAFSFISAEIDWTHQGAEYAEGFFASLGKRGRPLVEAVSGDHPDLVIRVSTVDAASGLAEAAVFRGSDCLGEYDMPEDEFAETAGSELDEGAVIDNLNSTVEAYVSDAVEALSASPRP